MNRSTTLWQFAGFAITSFLGTILHFLYDWSNSSIIVAPFSGVNESTWEHMKLLYFPLFIFAIVQCFYFNDCKDFWCIKLIGITTGLILIPIIYYTYNGAFGASPDWFNISIFFIANAIAFYLENILFKSGTQYCKHQEICLGIICAIGVLFVLFTFIPPTVPLFRDPISGKYGI